MNTTLMLVSVLLLATSPKTSTPSLALPGNLAGAITGVDGAAIEEDAQVRALDIANPNKIILVHVKNGFFSLTVPAGYYCLEASANGYRTVRTKTVQVAPSATELIDIQLQKIQPQERTSLIESILTSESTWLTALIGALWSSIFLPYFHAWLNRPLLRVEAEPIEPFSNTFHRQLSPYCEVGFYFLRIRITNEGKRDEAEEVDVSVNRTWEIDGREVRILDHFIPANLRWSNTWNVAEAGTDKGSDKDVLVKSRISAGGGQRYCDLGFLVHPEQVETFCRVASVGQYDIATLPQKGEVVFMLAMDYIRPWPPRSLRPGEYWLELICDAKNTKPTLFWLRLKIPEEFDFDNGRGIEIRCDHERPLELRERRVWRRQVQEAWRSLRR